MKAIDFHVHVPRQPGLATRDLDKQLSRYFKNQSLPKDADEMADHYAKWDIMAVLFSVDSEAFTGEPPDSNAYIASIVAKYPKQFIGFAGIDPWKGKAAVLALERAVKDHDLRGLKLHPNCQAFFANDTRFYPLYEKACELNIPILFHTGFSGVGANEPGGDGYKLKYSAPIPYIDDVAADFPDLKIIMAHPAWPWIDEQIAVALHKTNVYIDLSGWMPKYIPEALIKEVNSRLQNKILFGSDYPYIHPDKWIEDFQTLNIKPEVQQKVLLENAKKLLQI